MDVFFYSAIFSLVLFSVGVAVFQNGWLKIHTSADKAVQKAVEDLALKVDWLTSERTQLMEDLVRANRKITKLQESEQLLLTEIGRLKSLLAAQSVSRIRVLGIWPQLTLDTEGERNAIEQVGFDYLPLLGDMATRENILRELRLDGFTIIEIGAHGDANGIHIHNNDVLDAGFWADALAHSKISIAILLACHSDLSIADAFRRSGVQHVIAALDEINDEDVVRFVRTFYQAYADKTDVLRAFHDARLVLDKREREKLVLR